MSIFHNIPFTLNYKANLSYSLMKRNVSISESFVR